MAEISVMMAAYNAEKYIRRALDSLLAQTFTDFDIIITDDGSTDQTGAIADEYAARDSRVHVLHQPNSGVCVTRNNCIDWTYRSSDSQWIIFMDSDDWIHPEMLERMLNAAKEKNVHICACGYAETTGENPVIDPKDLEPKVWEPMAFYQAHYVNAIMTCCKLYHKDCYRDVRHPVDNYFDDEFVSYKMLYPEKEMVVISAPLYCYFINNTGLTKKPWTPRLLDAWVAYEEQIAFFKEKNRPGLVKFRYRGYLENAMVNYRAANAAESTPEVIEARERIRKTVRQLLRRMWHEGCINFWIDFDILYTFYPTLTRAYRLWLEVKSRLGGKTMAEISVIVPVYKAEDYLAASISSVLNQTFSDFELILVDDGSPDRCGEICEEYARKDSRITVLHQENQGQAAARNHALDIAKAPWVCFVDSDDLIHPRTLELLYHAAKESGAAMSMCRMLESPELPVEFMGPRQGTFRVHAMDDETVAKMYDDETYPAWVACGKLIARDVVDGYRFCPGRVYEDNEAVCRWIVAAGTLAEIPEELYFYRTNPGSTTQRSFSLKRLDFLWALESITGFYGSVGFDKTRQRFFQRYVLETAYSYRMVKNALKLPKEAGKIQRNFCRFLTREKLKLTKPQFEYLLDAMHPRLIRLYWPVAGVIGTVREDGLGGVTRKLKKHLGGQ